MYKDWLFSEKIVGFNHMINNSSNAVFIGVNPIIIECGPWPSITIEGSVEWEETDVVPFCRYPKFKK